MKVLHDYDNVKPFRSYAFRRGLRMVAYAISDKLGLGLFPMDDELESYMETLIKLDKLVGVEPIVGIRDKVLEAKPHLFQRSQSLGADTRRHFHVGADNDPKRVRGWDPPLTLSRAVHMYDREWVKGTAGKIGKGDVPIWHVDYPHLLPNYIDFLYRWKILGESPYGEEQK